MQNENKLTSVQQEMQSALGSLQPSRAGIDRDELMFNAGLSVGSSKKRPWQVLSVVVTLMLACSVVLHTNLWTAGKAQQNWQYTQQETPTITIAKWDSNHKAGSYIQLRNKVLDDGIDALGQDYSSGRYSDPPMSRKELLESMLSS